MEMYMIIYRPNRETLKEAMAESKEFDNEDDMKKYIVEQHEGLFDVDDIVFSEYSINDTRIGWKDCRYVCVKRYGNIDFMQQYGTAQCICMYATDYPKKEI